MARRSTRQRRAQRIARIMPIVEQLREHTGQVDGSWMTRRHDYRPDEPDDLWLATPFSRNGRGDQPLAESNYRVIVDDLRQVAGMPVDYRIDLWPGGSIHTIQVRADDALALRAVQRWVDALADYPIADDRDYSVLRWEHDHPSDGECYADEGCGCPARQAGTDGEVLP
jgi:hypothetical protein